MGCCAFSGRGDERTNEGKQISLGLAAKLSMEDSVERTDVRITLKAEETTFWICGLLERYYTVHSSMTYGDVRKVHATHTLTGQHHCIKVIPKNKRRNSEKLKGHLLNSLTCLDHPHILKTFEVCEDAAHLFIISEDYEGGTLADRLEEQRHFSEAQAAKVLGQVLSALAYSHAHGLPHRRVHTRSIIFFDQGDNVALTDFDSFLLSLETSHLGIFAAPETRKGLYTDTSDVWSCGVLLSNMLIGVNFQHSECSLESEAESSQKLCSEDAMMLLTSMLDGRPGSRPSLTDCLSHPFLKRCNPTPPSSPSTTFNLLSRPLEKPNTLKAAIDRFLVHRFLSSLEVAEATHRFESLDWKHDGVVTREELKGKLSSLVPSSKIDAVVDKIVSDTDRNRVIDYSEFLLRVIPTEILYSDDKLRAAFQILDTDGNGRISLYEMQALFSINVSVESDKEWKRLMAEADTSGDGLIDFEEFKELMRKTRTY